MIEFFKRVYLNLSFFIFAVLFSLVSVPVLTIYVVLPAMITSRRETLKRLRLSILIWGHVICYCSWPLIRISYLDKSPGYPVEPCVFVANHRSFSDGFLISFPTRRYEGVQVVSRWPFRIPFLGIIAKLAGYIDVSATPFDAFSSTVSRLLSEGVVVAAFPEGTRSGARETGQFHGGIFRAAMDAKCSIVPVCIAGNENMPPCGSPFMRPGKITISKLPEIKWAAYKDMTPFTLKEKVRNMIIDELEAIEV